MLQAKSMGGGQEISLGKGNRAQEMQGYRRCTGFCHRSDMEKRKGKGDSRWLFLSGT